MIKTLDKRLTDLVMSAAGTYEIRLLAGEARDEIRLTADRIAALESEVAALRHDIERATQRNSDLLAEVEGMRDAVDEYALGDERYNYVRRLNAMEFAKLYQRNIKEGIPFDDLIDAARIQKARKK